MKFLTDEQLSELQPAETSSFPSPVPTQIVSGLLGSTAMSPTDATRS